MFEHKSEKVISNSQFYQRVAIFLGFSLGVLLIALGIGVLGYHFIAGFDWIDALLNASMILTGMGPIGELKTDGAKVFASIYALFSGLIFITLIGIVFAPFMHRIVHKFHIDEKDLGDD